MSDYPRCEMCEHWHKPDREYVKRSHGQCQLSGSSSGAPENDSLMTAIDMESYSAILRTEPDFGCIHHSDLNQGEDTDA